MKNSNYYNKKSIYTSEIEPLINKLKIICNLEKMPMFITVAVKNTEKETEYMSDMVLASSEVNLTDNRIASILLRINGFEDRFPDYIVRDIQELQEYLERQTKKLQDSDSTDLHLKDDLFPDLLRITEGGNTAVPPTELLEQKITADEAEGIGTAQNTADYDIKKDLD